MSYVVCPHCRHKYTADDMCASKTDLWAVAPAEQTVTDTCPFCGKEFWIQGGYIPKWACVKTEDELD